MFVLTLDQRSSRRSRDRVPEAVELLGATGIFLLPPERTAGDEIQTLTDDPALALDAALALTRDGSWSVGIGVGGVELPLPDSVRAGRGDAFVHARDAVERAKSTPTRLALAGDDPVTAGDAEALIRLLVELRDARTAKGWELAELLATGMTQRDAATRLGITDGAVSLRARAAGLRTEEAAIPALRRVLANLADV